MTLKILVPPVVEPISLTEVKAWLRLDHAFEDALILQLIETARLHAEKLTRHAFITQTIEQIALANVRTGLIDLGEKPLQSIQSVAKLNQDGTEQTLDTGAYIVDLDGARIRPINGHFSGSYRIVYIAGYGDLATDISAPLKTAILLLVAWLFEHRDGDAGALPREAQSLLSNYVAVRL
ncbi:MAG: hypothetical protein COA47_06465 [Robiginitomaculum sp.]|nr:MAG: hypothetical protein COA47_06465 [Robiginitomaculum sp.]